MKKLIWSTCVNLLLIVTEPSASQVIPFNTRHVYNFKNKVSIYNDMLKQPEYNDYSIDGKLFVESVWNDDDKQIIGFQFKSLNLELNRITNELDELNEKWFCVVSNKQTLVEFYAKEKDISLLNLQRAICSLFQVNFKDGKVIEQDVSGNCTTVYEILSSTKIKKTKKACTNWSINFQRRHEKALGVKLQSHHEVDFITSQDGTLYTIASIEKHSIGMNVNSKIGGEIESLITLKHLKVLDYVEKSLGKLTPEFLSAGFTKLSLQGEVDYGISTDVTETRNLTNFLSLYREELLDNKTGTREHSLLFIELLAIAKNATLEELKALLKSVDYVGVRNTQLDALGAAQTVAGYEAVTSIFAFDNKSDLKFLEKYVQALSLAATTNEPILRKLVSVLENSERLNHDLKDSISFAISAMAYRYRNTKNYNKTLYMDVKNYILSELKLCGDSIECSLVHIRGLGNIKDESTIDVLIRIAIGDIRRLSVAAMKALKKFSLKQFKKKSLKVFEGIFSETYRKFDSSARLLALDVLLAANPTENQLLEYLKFASDSNNSPELRIYVLQKIKMLSVESPIIASMLNLHGVLRNYDILAQNALSTVLSCEYSSPPLFNGSLISTQEVNGGILKRGFVEMKIFAENSFLNMLTLELSTSGLGSLFGTDSDIKSSEEDKEDTITAGMEISVLESQMRPLIFFNGQGELMGHVWSGTASEPTSAYSANVQLQNQESYIVLQNGATIYFKGIGASSIDINGQIQISLWNRNAHTEIRKSAGTTMKSDITLGTSFVKLHLNLIATMQPDVHLIADVDFYSSIKLCIQLSRVKNTMRMISKHSSQGNSLPKEGRQKTYSFIQPGLTFSLNKKNEKMCNSIFA